tara:strand:- start:76 stop:312 length:237 start_codon:yes stop_codon:yes gene_type:complete
LVVEHLILTLMLEVLEDQVQVVQTEELMQVEQELVDKETQVVLLNQVHLPLTLLVEVVVLAVQELMQLLLLQVQVVQD